MPRPPFCLAIVLLASVASNATSAPPFPTEISPARILPSGLREHSIRSPFQKSETKLRVLLPSERGSATRRHILYVLPVEPANELQYGDPLEEIRKSKLHEQLQLICVYPTFDRMPWYADHPTDLLIRQESHFLKVIVPFVDRAYVVQPTAAQPGSSGRWLLGFSKGGWGAFSLLLRNPELFDRAAAWDVPFELTHPDRYGMADIFGSKENFERYRIPLLLEKVPDSFPSRSRLVLSGYGLFRSHHQGLHQQLLTRGIPHQYRDGPQRTHRWDSGWLPETIQLLANLPPGSTVRKNR